MTYSGTVQKGVIVLDGRVDLPEGSRVNVSVIDPVGAPGADPDGAPSVFEQLQDLAGTVEGLPADIAENHDHYLYGTRKR